MGDVELLFKMAESTDEVKGQFLFCPVCRLNHDQGRKHIYTRKHKTLLGKILLKFGKKVSSLQRKDVCIHNCEEKQTNIFKILRNLFTPTDQNILLILEFVHFFFPPVDTTESPCEYPGFQRIFFSYGHWWFAAIFCFNAASLSIRKKILWNPGYHARAWDTEICISISGGSTPGNPRTFAQRRLHFLCRSYVLSKSWGSFPGYPTTKGRRLSNPLSLIKNLQQPRWKSY